MAVLEATIHVRGIEGERSIPIDCSGCCKKAVPSIWTRALSTLSPYRTEHINRFGNYVIDFNRNAGTVGIAPGSFFIATLGVIGQSVCFLILTGVQGYIVGSVTRLLEGIQLPAFGLS
jgi:hypothetical protein